MNQASALASIGRPQSAVPPQLATRATTAAKGDVEAAANLREAYTQFVGETLFGSMLKAARKTVGEPAYFHGGMAEEQFQARLDQQWAADLASSGSSFSEGMFRSEFPTEAKLLAEQQTTASDRLAELNALRRR